VFRFKPWRFFILAALVASLPACAAERTDLVDTGAVDVRVADRRDVSIFGVGVVADGGETIVFGRVRRLGVHPNPFSAKQITGVALLPDGSIRQQSDDRLTRTPQPRSFQTVYPAAKFEVVFPEPLPRGTTLVLSFDDRRRSGR
jgi:hypothetical protein